MSAKPLLIQKPDFKGCRVTVLGLGRFGGGIAVVNYLARRGAHITVIDVKTEEALSDSLRQIEQYAEIRYELGSTLTELPEIDLLVANPAIPPAHPLLKSALEQQIPVTSEIELFWELNPGRVIGVTGSNGKSTTTAMVHTIMQASGARCWLGGNIGVSLLPVVEQIQPEDWVILELSSFQLEALNRIQASPQIGVVSNFSPNHLDWHQTVEHYRRAKQTIFRWQSESDFAVINADDPDLQSWSIQGSVSRFGVTPRLKPDVLVDRASFVLREQKQVLQPHLNVPGMHNRINAAAAIAACRCAGVDLTTIQKGLEAFQGLPHRLQFIGEFQHRRFYNDSLATTPESAICALEAFDDSSLILLAGGSDKKVDLTEFASVLLDRTKATALMGETGLVLSAILQKLKTDPTRHHLAVISPPQHSFQEAFEWAFQQSDPGDVILLSPGCASYGWFTSFAERGERFTEQFQRLSDGSDRSAQQ